MEQLDLGQHFFEQGTSGFDRSGGFVIEEFLTDLRNAKGRRTLREMADNDPIIAATLNIVEQLLRQTTIRFEPRQDTQLGHKIKDYVESCWHDIIDEGGTGAVISEALTALIFGWSWLEKVYKVRGGIETTDPKFRSHYNDHGIGWQKFPGRAQETLHRWEFGDRNRIKGWIQMAAPAFSPTFLERQRALHFRFRGRKNNPEGYSFLRGAYQSWYHCKHFRFIEAVGTERDLAGYPVFTIPMKYLSDKASAAEQAVAQKYFKMGQRVRRDRNECLVMPPEEDEKGNKTGYSFKLTSSGGRRPGDVDVIIKRYESRIAMTLLSEFLLLGQDKVGSFSLSSDKTDMFSLGLASILDTFVEEFTSNAIPELVSLNGWPAELSPRMEHGDIESPNLAELAAFITATVGTGAIIRDDKLEKHLREVASFPEAEDLGAEGAPAGLAQQAAAGAPPRRPSTRQRRDAGPSDQIPLF